MTLSKIITGAESFFSKGNNIGILLCHGFNGTPQSIEYIAHGLSKKGYTVFAPRLSGHGTCIEDLENRCYQEWLSDLEKAFIHLSSMCKRIFVLGQSMGGALALQLATKTDLDGVITINAALEVPDYEPYKNLNSPRFIPDDNPDIKDPEAKEITYSQVPIKSVKQLLALMEDTKQTIHNVSVPLLLFKSPEDHVVPAHCSHEIYHQASSVKKKLITLHNSYHVASLDYDKELIVQTTIAFVEDCLKKAEAS